MPRLLIIIAAIPIIITFLIRWWSGLRILKSNAELQCHCDLEKWKDAFGETHTPPSASGDLIIYAELLRKIALADWRVREPKMAISREGTRRFAMAVPPLTAIVVVMAALVARIPIPLALAIFLLTIALTAVTSYLTLAPEIKAILITSRRLSNNRIFPRKDDEDAVIQSAIALSWKEAAPPIYNLLQR